MTGTNVRVETREMPAGDGRQISARRYGSVALEQREADLQAAVDGVLASMVKVVERAPKSPLRVGALEVSFNVAFAPDEGAYLCSSADGTFAVKVSLELLDAGGNSGGSAAAATA